MTQTTTTQSSKVTSRTRLLPITPVYEPPETLSEHLKGRVDTALAQQYYTHIAIIDADVEVPKPFWYLCDHYPDADIIGTTVVPSSRIHRLWEKTYRVKLKPRVRDCATIYSTRFLERVGWPESETPGTVLQQQARIIIHSDVRVIHNQSLSLRHSVKIQLRDGRSRAMVNYPFWKTLLHSIFRVRPLVLYGYASTKLEKYRLLNLIREQNAEN